MRKPAIASTLLLSSVALVSLVAPLAGCGGAAGEKVRPKDITAVNALGSNVPSCTADPKLAQPLVIDLEPPARVALEVAMKKRVVVVAYDCKSLRVLPTCNAPVGTYEYAGVSQKEQVVQMKNQDELSVNLPLSSGKVGAEMKSGNAIDLALVYVGQRSTTVEKIDHAEMTGNCEGATHFLQTASIGAFSIATGSAGKVAAVTEIFKVGASGSSSSEKNAGSSDGSLDACRASDPDALEPPKQCRTPISVVLQPLAGHPKVAEATKAKDGKGKDGKDSKDGKEKEAKPLDNPCPAGFVFANGICSQSVEAAHLCKPENVPDCKAQCEKGSAGSCYSYAAGKTLPEAEREAYYKKACDGGHSNGCGWYALFRWKGGDETKSPANKEPIEIARRGCAAGGSEACVMLGDFLWNWEDKGPFSDLPASIHAFDRACQLGDPEGCSKSAEFHYDGVGVPKNELKAFELLDRACSGGQPYDCVALGRRLATSKANPDPARAFNLAQRACKENVTTCTLSAEVADILQKETDAFTMLKSACERDPIWCDNLADRYAKGEGTAKDPAKAREAYGRTCEAMKAGDFGKELVAKICAKADVNGAPSAKPSTAKTGPKTAPKPRPKKK